MVSNRSDRKHAAILEAAEAEFRAHGFQGTSMDRIAQRADVSKRTVYNHFESKESLFEDITAALWARVHQAVEVDFDPEAPAREQLLRLAHAEMQVVSDPDFVSLARVVLGEYFHSPDKAREAFQRLSEEDDGITRWVRAATEHGCLTVSDPPVAATQLAALLKAFCFWPQVLGGMPPPDEQSREGIAESAVSMFLDHYGT